MAGQNTLTFTDGSFDQDVLRSEVPVLVDFWAEWCGPCRQMAPTIDVVAQEYAGKLKVGKLDVDSNINTAGRYNIRGIPTLLLFKEGRVVEQRVGAVGKAEVVRMVEAHVGAEKLKVKVGEPDGDSNINTAGRYTIRGIPTLLLFKEGRVVEQRVGAVGKSEC